jgi:hypothetical protein
MARLDSEKVYKFIGGKVRTTAEIAAHFKVGLRQAAAAVAILRIKETVEPASPPKDSEGVSRWRRA